MKKKFLEDGRSAGYNSSSEKMQLNIFKEMQSLFDTDTTKTYPDNIRQSGTTMSEWYLGCPCRWYELFVKKCEQELKRLFPQNTNVKSKLDELSTTLSNIFRE